MATTAAAENILDAFIMAHYVYVSIGMSSTLHGTVALCRQLTKAGHKVTVVSHRDIGSHVEKAGLSFRGLLADRAFVERAGALKRPAALNLPKLAAWIWQRRRIRQESIEQRELEAVAAELKPDAVLIDLECHFALIALSALNLPIITISFFFSVLREASVPPLNSPLHPGVTPEARKRIRDAWRHLRREHMTYLIKQHIGPERIRHGLQPVDYGTRHTPNLARIARSRGVNMRELVAFNQWLRPFMPAKTPVVSLNARELEFPEVSHSRLHYAGPIIDPKRIEPDESNCSTENWNDFKLRRQAAKSPKRPLIYCSHGSFRRPDGPFFDALLETFRRRPDWDLVLGLGAKIEPPAELEALPNVLCLKWAPQLQVLDHADCAVHHGGVSTVNECAYCSVPMVIYPCELDQEGCGARVAFHGVGVAGSNNGWRAISLERDITRCLEDETIAAAVKIKQAALRKYDDQNKAVRLIEDLTFLCS